MNLPEAVWAILELFKGLGVCKLQYERLERSKDFLRF